jgi:hypothetical protein
VSFTRRTIRWRGHDYRIVEGNLVPVRPEEVLRAQAAARKPEPALRATKSSGDA